MLRSGHRSPAVRLVGYTLAGAFAAFFVYLLVLLALVSSEIGDAEAWLWLAVWGGLPAVVVVGLGVYVARSQHQGGYAIIGGASFIASLFAAVGLVALSGPF